MEKNVVKTSLFNQAINEESNFLIFRKIKVPEDIRHDEETERVRRSDVLEREIGVVFGTDAEGNLIELKGKLAGVYSFLPVEGEQTGLPFGIFGDLIPQPDRDLINYNARWNQWMVQEVYTFFQDVLCQVLLTNDKWKIFPAQLLNALNRTSVSGPSKDFWSSNMVNPLINFLMSEEVFVDEKGAFHKLEDLIVVNDDVKEAVGMENLSKVIGNKKIPHRSINERVRGEVEVEKLDLYTLIHNKKLESFKEQPNRLVAIYRQISKLSDYSIKGRKTGGQRDEPLSSVKFVLADDLEFHSPKEVVTLQVDVEQLPQFLRVIMGSKKLLHPDIARDIEAVNQLARCGLEVVNRQNILLKLREIVKEITDKSKCPTSWSYPEDLIKATLFIASEIEPRIDRLVAQDETLQSPSDLFIPNGNLDWEQVWNAQLLPGFKPIHNNYFVSQVYGP